METKIDTHALVSFLGKQPPSRTQIDGYRKAKYQFSDGKIEITPFFGLALLNRLRPQQVIILGTCGSMWDVLVEHLASEGEDEDLRIELIDAAKKESVTQELLDKVEPLISQTLAVPCTLRTIPYGRDTTEQTLILDTIAKTVRTGRVTVDLTHGFRHLAAIGLVSAFFLEQVRGLTVEALYYGALEMTKDDITPVLSLDGMMVIQRWISAVERFDQNGDYSVFAPLLEADGIPADKIACLKHAAYFERTLNLSNARNKLQTFLTVLKHDLTGISRLFQDQLKARLSWAETGDLLDHQRHLARFYLKNSDYVRAAIFSFEAVLTKQCQQLGYSDIHDYEQRKKAEEVLRQAMKDGTGYSAQQRTAYEMLRNLRNALAHGQRSKKDRYRKIINDQELLTKELKKAMDSMDI